jgi:type II secretory pathway component PulC
MVLSFLLQALLAAPPGDLTALGAVFGPTKASAVAVLRAGGKTRVVAVGESAFGGRLLSVDARAAILQFGSERVEVPLAASVAPRGGLAHPVPGAPSDEAGGARSMERREVERRLGEEVPRILAETTVVPVTEDGRVTGLALTRVPEGTLLTDAGLQAGDVLTRVNDTAIDGLPALMALWPRLQGASQLQAVVLRNGQPVSLTITLR